jgi:predicted amidohydrolase
MSNMYLWDMLKVIQTSTGGATLRRLKEEQKKEKCTVYVGPMQTVTGAHMNSVHVGPTQTVLACMNSTGYSV